MEAPDIRRKLEDDENRNRKTANDDSLGVQHSTISCDFFCFSVAGCVDFSVFLCVCPLLFISTDNTVISLPNFNFLFAGAMSNIEMDNTRFVHGQQQQTQEMIGQQDVALDSLGNAVDRLEGMGRTINTELKGE